MPPVRPLLLAVATCVSACGALRPEPLIEPYVHTTDVLEGQPEPAAPTPPPGPYAVSNPAPAPALAPATFGTVPSAPPERPAPSWIRIRMVLKATIADHELAPLGTIEDFWIGRDDGRIETVAIDLDGTSERLFAPAQRLRWDPKDGPSLLNLHASDLQLALQERQIDEQAKLLQTRPTTHLEGTITEVVEPAEGERDFVYLKLRQPNNHFHRVLIAPADYTRAQSFPLAVDHAVAVEAVETRDEKGRLWVAKSLAVDGGQPLPLRKDDGQPVWERHGDPGGLAPLFEEPVEAPPPDPPAGGGVAKDAPPEGGEKPAEAAAAKPADGGSAGAATPAAPVRVRLRATELIGAELPDPAGEKASVTGLIVDDPVSVAAFAVVETSAGERLLPWQLLDLRQAPGEPGRLRIPLHEIEASPAVRAGSLGDVDFWSAERSYYEAKLASVAAAAPAPPAAAELAPPDGPPPGP